MSLTGLHLLFIICLFYYFFFLYIAYLNINLLTSIKILFFDNDTYLYTINNRKDAEDVADWLQNRPEMVGRGISYVL